MAAEELVSVASENKTRVVEFYEIINSGKYDQLDSILDSHVIWHDPLLPSGEVRGIDNFKKVLKMFRSAFPDLHIKLEDQIVEGDKVVTRFVISATHKGDLMGIPSTGKPIKVTGISIIRFTNGKMVEEWIEEDGLGMMRQLGISC